MLSGSPICLSRRLICAGGLCAVLLVGCGRLKQQVKASVDSSSQLRQSAIDASRKSCIQTASEKAPKLPGIQARIGKYCDCFANKGMGKFSNSELTKIGLNGGKFTPEQQAKIIEGVQLCQGELTAHSQ